MSNEVYETRVPARHLMRPCPMCAARGKTWEGSDPKCAFPSNGKFHADNWNCATANALRSLAEDREGTSLRVRNDDESWAVIDVITVDLNSPAKTLWLSWYKERGRTDQMLLLSDDGTDTPSYEDCDAILRHYGASLLSAVSDGDLKQ